MFAKFRLKPQTTGCLHITSYCNSGLLLEISATKLQQIGVWILWSTKESSRHKGINFGYYETQAPSLNDIDSVKTTKTRNVGRF
ncbi:hypothetical protein SLA2020_467750 [Shorea laevis]